MNTTAPTSMTRGRTAPQNDRIPASAFAAAVRTLSAAGLAFETVAVCPQATCAVCGGSVTPRAA